MTTYLTRIATILVAIAITLGMAGPAQASRRAEGTRHNEPTSWLQPPSNLDTFRNIYGGRATGFVADHVDTSTGGWVNTMWPARHVILFQYCENKGKGAADVYACQTAWDGFYAWMRDHRDGTLQDWIELQHP